MVTGAQRLRIKRKGNNGWEPRLKSTAASYGNDDDASRQSEVPAKSYDRAVSRLRERQDRSRSTNMMYYHFITGRGVSCGTGCVPKSEGTVGTDLSPLLHAPLNNERALSKTKLSCNDILRRTDLVNCVHGNFEVVQPWNTFPWTRWNSLE